MRWITMENIKTKTECVVRESFRHYSPKLDREQARKLVLIWAEKNHEQLERFLHAHALLLLAPTPALQDAIIDELAIGDDYHHENREELLDSLVELFVAEIYGFKKEVVIHD